MRALLAFAIGLIFISKISFQKLIPQIPSSFSYFVFQGGIHPYMNFIGVGLVAFLSIFALKTSPYQQSRHFRLSVFFISFLLILQGIFQSLFVEGSGGFFATFAAIAGALLLMFVYGIAIPRVLPASEILSKVWKWCFWLSFLSLCLWVIAPHLAFRGGRFTGLFKHIPHMVSVGMFCFALSYYQAPGKVWKVLGMAMGLFILVLTGTRSALAASVMVVVLDLIFSRAKDLSQAFKKAVAGVTGLLVAIFFGLQILGYTADLATGEKSLGDRQAQDGIASRWEEVERGWDYFLKEPLTGYGLAAKFVGSKEADISSYNSFKDPHNIFVSAAVTAGWPGFALSFLIFIVLSFAVVNKLVRPKTPEEFQVAVILATQLPILVIYHVHLSVGGVADRLYWLLFGLLALASQRYQILKQS